MILATVLPRSLLPRPAVERAVPKGHAGAMPTNCASIALIVRCGWHRNNLSTSCMLRMYSTCTFSFSGGRMTCTMAMQSMVTMDASSSASLSEEQGRRFVSHIIPFIACGTRRCGATLLECTCAFKTGMSGERRCVSWTGERGGSGNWLPSCFAVVLGAVVLRPVGAERTRSLGGASISGMWHA